MDIAVIQEDVFHTEYRDSQSDYDYGFRKVTDRNGSFKDDVEECLKKAFGNDIERKNKSIKIHGNTYRKDTDIVPSLRYRDYRGDYHKNVHNYIGGILINTDDGKRIINYPEQHIIKGKEKNSATNYHYKKAVRIFKTLRQLMVDNGDKIVGEISSFQIESLIWNCPNYIFKIWGKQSKGKMIEEVIEYLIKHIWSIENYKEANGIKPLCNSVLEKVFLKLYIKRVADFFEYEG